MTTITSKNNFNSGASMSIVRNGVTIWAGTPSHTCEPDRAQSLSVSWEGDLPRHLKIKSEVWYLDDDETAKRVSVKEFGRICRAEGLVFHHEVEE